MLSGRCGEHAAVCTHVGSVKRCNAVIVPAAEQRLKAHITCGIPIRLRIFDVLDCLLLGKDPLLPLRVAIGHASEDDLRDLEARVPKADWNNVNAILTPNARCRHTILHLRGGRHCWCLLLCRCFANGVCVCEESKFRSRTHFIPKAVDVTMLKIAHAAYTYSPHVQGAR